MAANRCDQIKEVTMALINYVDDSALELLPAALYGELLLELTALRGKLEYAASVFVSHFVIHSIEDYCNQNTGLEDVIRSTFGRNPEIANCLLKDEGFKKDVAIYYDTIIKLTS